MTDVDGRTRVLGLFGYPVEHSLSPRMHNAAFRYLDVNAVYVPFSVRPQDLEDALTGVRTLGLAGVNLTIPHKVAALSLVDEVAPRARAVGAINTVTNSDGRLIGDNTDLDGVTVALEEVGTSFGGKTVVIAGAGGAARAAAFAAAFGAARQIVVLNRTPGRASELARALGDCATLTSPLSDLPLWLRAADILINATPIGLHESDPPLTDLDGLRPGAVVCDLAYRPGGTALISRARELGHVTVDGLTILVHQGARSFKLWTGLDAPVDVMRRAVVAAG